MKYTCLKNFNRHTGSRNSPSTRRYKNPITVSARGGDKKEKKMMNGPHYFGSSSNEYKESKITRTERLPLLSSARKFVAMTPRRSRGSLIYITPPRSRRLAYSGAPFQFLPALCRCAVSSPVQSNRRHRHGFRRDFLRALKAPLCRASWPLLPLRDIITSLSLPR